jgi:hypothetical protein
MKEQIKVRIDYGESTLIKQSFNEIKEFQAAIKQVKKKLA